MPKQTRQPMDILLVLPVIALLIFGVIMVLSSSSARAYADFGDAYHYFKRQTTWAILGLAAMYVTSKIDYRIYRRYTGWILGITLGLLALVLVIGQEIAGSTRWINLGFFNLQPSELAKLAMVFFTADYLARVGPKVHRFFRGYLPPLLVVGVVCGLIMLEPDLGTSVAIGGTVMMMLFAGGAKLWHLLLTGAMAVPAVVYLIFTASYRLKRLTAFIDPEADPLGTGYQIIQSLLAMGSGGLVGLGLGQSRQKFWYLPEQHTDFIYSIIGEELGFIGTSAILFLFLMLAWRGFRLAITSRDHYASLLAAGITSMILFQAMLNIGVVSGSLPVTGITLPLISYGGSSLSITLAFLGVLLNISRNVKGGV